MPYPMLRQLGFSEKEIDVYLAILKQGRVLPADVAKQTGLNRSTVYSVASELLKRGIVKEDLGGPVRYLVAQPPEDLMQLASREEQALVKKKKLLQETVLDLQSLVAGAVYTPPKIAFVTQEEIRNYMRKRTPVWNESIMKTDKFYWGYQDHTFVDAYGDWIDWYWTQAVPKGLHLILLSNKSETEKRMVKKQYVHREIRFWKDAGEFTATLWIMGEYVVMIATRQEPHYLVEIHDAVLANNLREVFKGINKGIGRS